MQQALQFIVRNQYDASFSANHINSLKQYVCVKLHRFNMISDYVIMLVCT